jgi:DNA-binding CsgD family transcriptional regulator
MTARNREIIELFNNGISPEEIAAIMGLTVEKILDIVEAA